MASSDGKNGYRMYIDRSGIGYLPVSYLNTGSQ